MKGLKKGDSVMVRDVKSSGDSWNIWCKAKIIECHRQPEGNHDVLELRYCKGGAFYKVLTSRFGGIAVPLDDDVATVLTFGEKAVAFLSDMRI